MYANDNVEMMLANKMDDLLEEARELGYYFTFNTVRWPNKVGRNEIVTIYSDEEEFAFDIVNSEEE